MIGRSFALALLGGCVLAVGVLRAAGPATTATSQPASKVELKDKKDKLSYLLGMQIGMQLKMGEAGFNPADINPEKIAAGIADIVGGTKPALSHQDIQAMQEDAAKEAKAAADKLAKEMAEGGAKNAQEGPAFLAANAKKDGVKVTPSGLQYKVLATGKGKTPKKTDIATVNYRGTFPNGEEFDSSYARNEPATFPVEGVIPGWTEALQLMREGDKFQLVIPAKLAYGDRGAPPKIAPNQVLVFEVELLSTKDAPAPTGMPAGHPAMK